MGHTLSQVFTIECVLIHSEHRASGPHDEECLHIIVKVTSCNKRDMYIPGTVIARERERDGEFYTSRQGS